MNGDYRPGDHRRPRHRGRNQNRRRHHDRPRRQDAPPAAPKQNPIVAFFARLFGLGKATNPAQRGPRPERRDDEMRPRDRRPRPEDRKERPQEGGRPGGQPQRRPVPAADITTPRLYVGNLSYDAGDSDLFDLFSQSGTVRNVEIARDRDNHRSKGFGFVEMDSVEAAKAAHAKFNGYEMLGRALVISGAKPPPERRSRPKDDEGTPAETAAPTQEAAPAEVAPVAADAAPAPAPSLEENRTA